LDFFPTDQKQNAKVSNGKVQSLLRLKEAWMSKWKVKTMLICFLDTIGITLHICVSKTDSRPSSQSSSFEVFIAGH
jgi:hypothetical protein